MTKEGSGRAASRTVGTFAAAIERAVVQLERGKDPVGRAKAAQELALLCRDAAGTFGNVRTEALAELREAGWSLADMANEFGIARARLSQIINREDYKQYRKSSGYR